MAAVKQLYDGTEAFQPYVEASNIPCGVHVSSNTVKDDIQHLMSRIQFLDQAVSGGQEVAGALGVEITYANLTTANKQDAMENENWSEIMSIPTTAAPYTWKKTEYTWTVNNQSSVIRTVYEISATALYPETQVMYTAIAAGQTSNLGGPSEYDTTLAGINDASTQGVKWYFYFPGIDASKPEGYMAVRHREAGQLFPNDGEWQISRMAQYPTNQ